MTYNFPIPPNQQSYSDTPHAEVLRTQLDGGAGRYRRNILNAAREVTCTWTLDRQGFGFANIFFRELVVSGSVPFTIDLYGWAGEVLETHTARFIPGTYTLGQQFGHTFIVSATLEVTPVDIPQSAIDDAILMSLFGLPFPMQLFIFDEILQEVTNVIAPIAMPGNPIP